MPNQVSSSPVILAIDDERAIRNSYSLYLEDYNFEVICAENGREGIEMFDQRQVDLVICDIRMPELDGIKVLEHIKSTRPEVPVIVVSGTGEADDLKRCLEAGATDFLMKPIQSLASLREVIEKAINTVQTNAKSG